MGYNDLDRFRNEDDATRVVAVVVLLIIALVVLLVLGAVWKWVS